jgi:hypothetical protein
MDLSEQFRNYINYHPAGDAKRTEWHDRLQTIKSPDKCLQIGVAPWAGKYGDNWISIDLYDTRPCIDHNISICDKEAMAQFKDTFAFIQCNAILEHVVNPFDAAKNLSDALVVGGILYCEVPFVQPYHPYSEYKIADGLLPKDTHGNPHGGDYWRFTPMAMIELFKELELVDIFQGGSGGIVYVGKRINK